jgi:hypothetical protein
MDKTHLYNAGTLPMFDSHVAPSFAIAQTMSSEESTIIMVLGVCDGYAKVILKSNA